MTTTTIDDELQKLLSDWDNGEIISTIEMGGLGPGYEQAIHITAFEMLRQLLEAKPSREDEVFKWEVLDPIIDKASEKTDYLGLSGAQWGAAKNIASRFYKVGYSEAKKTIPDDRRIMVQKGFPQS